MSKRSRKPCGTPAAYQRHIRAGEKPCKKCCQARNDYRRSMRLIKRREETAIVALKVAEAPHEVATDPLQDALENLRVVTATMQAAPAQAVAALSKRRQELVEFIASINASQEVSIADELAAARSRRADTADSTGSEG